MARNNFDRFEEDAHWSAPAAASSSSAGPLLPEPSLTALLSAGMSPEEAIARARMAAAAALGSKPVMSAADNREARRLYFGNVSPATSPVRARVAPVLLLCRACSRLCHIYNGLRVCALAVPPLLRVVDRTCSPSGASACVREAFSGRFTEFIVIHACLWRLTACIVSHRPRKWRRSWFDGERAASASQSPACCDTDPFDIA